MKREDDPELWDLLGHTAEPEISPFFARNVLRKIRQPTGWQLFLRRFHLPRLISGASLATFVLTILFLRWSISVSPLGDSPSVGVTTAETLESEVITDLDELLAVDDSNSLEENFLL